jgi:hypothetical protein
VGRNLAENQQDKQADRDTGSLALDRVDVSARGAVQNNEAYGNEGQEAE